MTKTERQLLEDFVVENRDLEELEAQLAVFNMFEALGAVRQELRHSDFLSFLLDPGRSHGLGDSFLKSLLKRALANAAASPVSAVEIDVADLSAVDVRREWRNIDILIHSPENKIVVAIENKIGSSEHSGQLGRYRDETENEFPDCEPVSIYLTPDGIDPSDDRWLPFSYSHIADIVEALLRSRRSTMGSEIVTAVQHYAAMLRRHIVTDSQIVALCQKIYRHHKAALDLIYEHRPDLQADLAELLRELVAEARAAGIVEDHSSKSYIRFTPHEWDSIPHLQTSKGWTRSGRLVLFEFVNQPDSLTLKLMLGPGPQEVRAQIHQVALADSKLFVGASKTLYKQWNSLLSPRPILARRDYEDAEFDELTGKVRRWWERFLEQRYPLLRDAMLDVKWTDTPEGDEAVDDTL